MIINHNIPALFTHTQNYQNNIATSKSMERLSSGMQINRAADDAAGLAVSEKMRAQIRGLNMATRNAQDGVNYIQTTDGYLQEMTSTVHRMRELAVQASNGIYTSEDRSYIQREIDQLVDEVDRIASQAHFNTHYMLTGRFADVAAENGGNPVASMWIHVGANMDERERLYVSTMTAGALGIKDLGTGDVINLESQDNANRAIGTFDVALERLNSERANLGAYQNRLESVVRQLGVASENFQASESRIRDTNYATESTDFATNQILQQSSIAMLAQANVQPQLALRLIQ